MAAANDRSHELHGWDQVATFLGVTSRTAQTYEREYGLPVHRRPGPKGRVWALADELQAWSKQNGASPGGLVGQSPEPPFDATESVAPRRRSVRGRWLLAGSLATFVILAAALITWRVVMTPHGVPAEFETIGKTLIIRDEQGQELWRHEFPLLRPAKSFRRHRQNG